MNENFLSFLWKFRYLDAEMTTESGEPLTILHPGDQNSDSGPDFFNARLRIGETTWAGNVELHLLASDWYRHGHQDDPAYDRVVLHVVYEADCQVVDRNGVPVQTLVLRGHYPSEVFERYHQMMEARQWIPCMNQLLAVAETGISLWLPALAVERLQLKSLDIALLMSGCGNDWDVALYRHMAGCFGFKINRVAFELLAKSLPLRVIRKCHDSLLQTEALLFGQAGMLNRTFSDAYPMELAAEYDFLRRKYNLKPVSEGHWKFLRLRPPNFPTIRISQFACLLHQSGARLFSLIEDASLQKSPALFNLTASAYWNDHYLFEKQTVNHVKSLGKDGERLLIINGLAPFMFYYGTVQGQPAICEGVVEYLGRTRGEQNSTISHWTEAGFPVENAMQTQALLHLKQAYCDKKRCLECRVGARLLGNAR